MNRGLRTWAEMLLLAGLAALLFGTGPAAAETEQSGEDKSRGLSTRSRNIFGKLPAQADNPENPITDEKVALGRLLYFEPRLSKNQTISCNSCHQLDRFGVDGEATSPGHKGQRGDRNSPTTLNAAIHLAQFWDGRAADVEEQAKGPILNPVEMAMPDAAAVVATLRSIPGYAPLFAAAFPDEADPISYDNLAKAIGAFERKLMTPARFDAFLEGDLSALEAQEEQGLRTFIGAGCVSCHMGPGVGGSLYQKLGLVHPYESEDTGREKATGKSSDRFFFKVPSLRNVAETGPYFHDGSIETLAEAVRLMGHHQLGRELSDEHVADIVSFLGSLTAAPDAELSAAPTLPESGPTTPKPDPS